MRTIYVLIIFMLLATISLWAGNFRKIKKLYALILACLFMSIAGAFLTCSVLPGNLVYEETVTNLHAKNLGNRKISAKTIALTFDDGPYEPYTSDLLLKLQEKNVKATFFIIAEQAEKYPDTVKKIAAAGHTIALHQYRHIDSLKLSQSELKESLLKGKETLKKLSGKDVKFWRPCHGFRDESVLSIAREIGLIVVNWDNIPRDWKLISAEEITRRVVKDAKPGSIVLLHDGDSPKYKDSRTETVNAVPKIIDELREQGYTFVVIE